MVVETIKESLSVNKQIATKKEETILLGKTSKNIIDLVEVGDIVNEKRVYALKGDFSKSDINNEEDFCYTSYSDECGLHYGIREDEIKTILTKEQYMQSCYTVERKKEC